MLRNLDYLRSRALSNVDNGTKEKFIEEIIGDLHYQIHDYLDVSRIIYSAVPEQVTTNCDLFLDGCLVVDELAGQLIAAVKQKRIP